MDTAIDIGFRRRISDIPAQHGMKENKKLPTQKPLTAAESAVQDGKYNVGIPHFSGNSGVLNVDFIHEITGIAQSFGHPAAGFKRH